jgi:glycosyltransferase involved in cell wall biosynthesis
VVGMPAPSATGGLAGLHASTQVIEVPGHATLAHVANLAADRWAGRDLALVFDVVSLPDAWLQKLAETLASEPGAATASALGIRDEGAESGSGDDGAAEDTWFPSRPGRPRVAGIQPTCVYVSRAAFELLGPLDERLGSSYAAVLDFVMRARRRGLANLLADDVVVGPAPAVLSREDEQTLLGRHGVLLQALAAPMGPAVERCSTLARVVNEPLHVTVDARALGPAVGGTRTYLFGLLDSLAADGRVVVRALVGDDLDERTAARLGGLPRTDLLTYTQALDRPPPSHIVHRPQQVFSSDDLLLLQPLGTRLVITHQDLIAYHNPTYFPSFETWQRYVRTTRQSLAGADQVIFFSRHALADAAREDLVETSRCSIVPLGVDPSQDAEATTQANPPATLPELSGAPFLLCIGADYEHKNRPFALALLGALRRQHNWSGSLVLAGSHMEHGSSREAEQETVAALQIPSGWVHDLGPVPEPERLWLMHNAAAVLYPTVQEGFGLLPFESAAAGVPCLFASQSSLRELLDPALAALVPWDPVRSAATAVSLLHDGLERQRHVEGLRRAAEGLTWAACGARTVDAYHAALASSLRASTESAWQALEREREIVLLDAGVRELDSKIRELTDDIGADGLALVGREALLSRADQRALLALTMRPWLRRLVLGVLRAGFRAARKLSPRDR